MSAESVERLLEELSLAEKVRLLSGSDFWHTAPVERLGIPRMQLSDGPVGVRGERTVGTTSVSFPCGSAIGASFDPLVAAELADALADECVDRGVQVLLGPTVNLQRHPLGGRHFECYSEDPVLTAELAVAYVGALQARGIGATVKHFVANDTEFERHTISSEVDEHVLRALYLVPFEEAVTEAGAWAVMSAYNKVNGTYAAENGPLLTEVLRDEWGFDGLVMSDWFGTYSTVASVLSGLDLEMPGPAIHYGERLERAVADGEVPAEVVTDRARRVLQLLERTGLLAAAGPGGPGGPGPGAETSKPAPAVHRSVGQRRELARRLAARTFVLLKNDPPVERGARWPTAGEPTAGDTGSTPLLPLSLRPGQLLAVVGHLAARTSAQGGGSAAVHPEHVVSVLEGLRACYAPLGVDVAHETGPATWEETPALEGRVELEYFPAATGAAGHGSPFDGEPVHLETSPDLPLTWLGDPVPGLGELGYGAFAVRARATYRAEATGPHELSLAQAGSARLFVDGVMVVEGSAEQGRRFFGFGSKEATAIAGLEAGTDYELVAEYEVTPGSPVAGLFIGLRPPLRGDDELLAAAAELAGRADAVVCVVGTSPEWESEGKDRTTMRLPGRQDDLVRAVTAANPATAVVLNTGSPVEMDWAELPAAIMQCWFGGEAVGRAAADVLSGADEPGGRLAHTVPVRLEDTPAFGSYPGRGAESRYEEGLLIGYRHYATRGVKPRYVFGHGLSYTTFVLGRPECAAERGGLKVVVPVTNTGARRGAEVVQVYLEPLDPAGGEPRLTFAGSARLVLAASETAPAEVTLVARRLSRLRPGGYRVLAGTSADRDGLVEAGTITAEG